MRRSAPTRSSSADSQPVQIGEDRVVVLRVTDHKQPSNDRSTRRRRYRDLAAR
jgi:hypothetical protein